MELTYSVFKFVHYLDFLWGITQTVNRNNFNRKKNSFGMSFKPFKCVQSSNQGFSLGLSLRQLNQLEDLGKNRTMSDWLISGFQ